MPQLNQFGQLIGDPVPDWQPRPYPAHITLNGTHCRMVPLRPDHVDDLWAAFALAPDTRHWTWLPDLPPQDSAEYQCKITARSESRDPLFFAILDARSGKAIGSFALMRIDEKNGAAEVGHVHFSPLLSGTIMATEAHYLLMKYVFDTLGYRRYEWKCNSLNTPSHNAALRLGFQYEGTFRQVMVVKGHNRDTEWFSVLDSEWPRLQRAFLRWLAPENFRADGSQIASLATVRESAGE